MNRYFFEQTNDLHEEIVSLHDFILPTASALWHFRQVMEEERRATPHITAAELAKKYNTAPETRTTTNLITPFQTHSWEAQRERLAEVALVNIIALFEIWCEEVCELFGQKELAIKLQHPTGQSGSDGIGFALIQLGRANSSVLRNSIYPGLIRSRKYSLASVDNLLRCFRYFKELRNCYMHRGRECDNRLYGSQSQFIPVANKAVLGMGFVPDFKTFRLGDDVNLSLRGVLGFTEVILRVVTTVDAELSATSIGEQVLVERIAANTRIPMPQKSLRALLTTIGLQGVLLTQDLLQFLRQTNVIK